MTETAPTTPPTRVPYFAVDPRWWPVILTALQDEGPLAEESACADLRWLQDQALRPRGPAFPSLRELAARWGWVSRNGQPSVKRVRLLVRDEPRWSDDRKAEAWAAYIEATGRVRGSDAPDEGHKQGTSRAQAGHKQGTTDQGSPVVSLAEGHNEGTSRAQEWHDKGNTRVPIEPPPTTTSPPAKREDAGTPAGLSPSSDEVDQVEACWTVVRQLSEEAGLGDPGTTIPLRWGFEERVLGMGPEPVLQVVNWLMRSQDGTASWQRPRGGLARAFTEGKFPEWRMLAVPWCRINGCRGLDVAKVTTDHRPWNTPQGQEALADPDPSREPYPAAWGRPGDGQGAGRWHAAMVLAGGWSTWCEVASGSTLGIADFQERWQAAYDELQDVEGMPGPWQSGMTMQSLADLPSWRPDGAEPVLDILVPKDRHGRPGREEDGAIWAEAWRVAGGSERFEALGYTPPGLDAWVLLWGHAFKQLTASNVVAMGARR